MPSFKERLTARVERVRGRRPLVDHAVRTVEHFSELKGSLQAGAVTYFAMLSVFPILALAFFAVGWIARVYPGAEEDLVTAVNDVLPGLIGEGEGQISLETIKTSYATIGLLGFLGVLYAGLGWISAMRKALVPVGRLVLLRAVLVVEGGLLGGRRALRDGRGQGRVDRGHLDGRLDGLLGGGGGTGAGHGQGAEDATGNTSADDPRLGGRTTGLPVAGYVRVGGHGTTDYQSAQGEFNKGDVRHN